jgi:hypothetical protein
VSHQCPAGKLSFKYLPISKGYEWKGLNAKTERREIRASEIFHYNRRQVDRREMGSPNLKLYYQAAVEPQPHPTFPKRPLPAEAVLCSLID